MRSINLVELGWFKLAIFLTHLWMIIDIVMCAKSSRLNEAGPNVDTELEVGYTTYCNQYTHNYYIKLLMNLISFFSIWMINDALIL